MSMNSPIRRTVIFCLGLCLLAMAPGVGRAAEALSETEKTGICLELTTLFRSARAVISANQALINDPEKGDKGLSGDAVVAAAKEKYQEAAGVPLPDKGSDTLAGKAQAAMLDAVAEVMNNAQPVINEQGKGFKGFLPAVFAKQVADSFSAKMQGQMAIKLTAPKSYVRNRANRPDEWEQTVIEDVFKSPDHTQGQEFAEHGAHKGRDGFRLMIPEYYKQSCLKCHGEPRGEKDITGGKKEGGKLGELGGAISVVIYD